MKLVKKILRLLPILSILCYFVAIIFNKNGYASPNELVAFIDIESGFFDTIVDAFGYFVPNNLLNWVNNYLNSSYFLTLCLGTLFYELYLSILFIMFDFINFVFGWANKFIKKGSNVDE